MFISTCIQVSSVYHAVLQGVYLCMYMHNCILYLYCTGLPVHIYRVCEHVCMWVYKYVRRRLLCRHMEYITHISNLFVYMIQVYKVCNCICNALYIVPAHNTGTYLRYRYTLVYIDIIIFGTYFGVCVLKGQHLFFP